ncbi:carbohydrate-binding family 9-like protein [Flavivirga amylovorans]|uniref:Carbohydrate-binding family 9-like protein n=1 Tax=Flavivirga amylovorans TaxID=870486 RepID=A0ABT8WYK0_9FLAO|nr:carbohydrate-binding family 9-like protein [Flavivirga amylovorans]MDO5986759.1 carbohydrate-binding family 9-like protein [Flavivirga amylovorans]
MKTYHVNSIPTKQLIITGKGASHLWDDANVLNDFSSPWEDLKDTKTTFRALWDDDYLFFCFHVFDDAIHIDNTDTGFNSINVSDRVEFFFRVNASLNPYYCLEIDPTPRIMDFKALPNKDFNFDWDWPKQDLVVNSNMNSKGFSVEGKISLASLKSLNLIHDLTIETGIFRATYYKTKELTYKPTWITWVDPKTDAPNFHTPSSFGTLKLEKNSFSI